MLPYYVPMPSLATAISAARRGAIAAPPGAGLMLAAQTEHRNRKECYTNLPTDRRMREYLQGRMIHFSLNSATNIRGLHLRHLGDQSPTTALSSQGGRHHHHHRYH
jgi:hypothetical protein